MSLKNVKYTSVTRIFTRLKGIIPLDNENDILEWIGDALEAIGAIQQYEEAVCFLKVENFMAKMPKNSYAVIQLARNNRYMPGINQSCFKPSDALEVFDPKTIIRMPLSLSDQEITNNTYCLSDCSTDDLGYTPIFSLTTEFNHWSRSDLYKNAFTPIRLTENTFFNSLVCREKDMEQIYQTCKDEYNIVGGDTLKFSFQDGQVALSYAKQKMDEQGYPMIPDNISYITAIVNYCIYKYFEREYYNSRQGSGEKMAKAEGEWVWYCGQAQNKAMMIEGVDEHQNFLDQRSYILPNHRRYFGFFGGLNDIERINIG